MSDQGAVEKRFTPGKWVKSTTVKGSIAGENGRLVCSMWQPENSPERIANENLIESATELLDAVESAMVFVETFFTEGVTSAWAADLEKELKKVYDKATGRTEPQELYGKGEQNATEKIKFSLS